MAEDHELSIGIVFSVSWAKIAQVANQIPLLRRSLLKFKSLCVGIQIRNLIPLFGIPSNCITLLGIVNWSKESDHLVLQIIWIDQESIRVPNPEHRISSQPTLNSSKVQQELVDRAPNWAPKFTVSNQHWISLKIDRKLVDKKLVDEKLVDKKLVDKKMVDKVGRQK